MIWKMTCYDMFIIYFNRGKNWFVPKCLVILARIKYMYIVYSYRTRKLLFWYTNPINECFFSTFNIIRDALVVNNFLCKYFNKQLNPPCLHSSQLRLIPYLHHKRTYPRFADFRDCKHNFPEIHEVNLRTLTERHVITFRKQLTNLLYQPAWTILVKLGEIINSWFLLLF